MCLCRAVIKRLSGIDHVIVRRNYSAHVLYICICSWTVCVTRNIYVPYMNDYVITQCMSSVFENVLIHTSQDIFHESSMTSSFSNPEGGG